jgi:hypothetical protein
MTGETAFPPTRYFGPAWARKPGEVQIPVPVGRICIPCEEPIGPDDMGTINFADQVNHHECLMRSVIGSVGHLRGICSCYGGTEEDPPGMTRREAAKAALALYNSPSITCPRCYRTSYEPEDIAEGYCRHCHGKS